MPAWLRLVGPSLSSCALGVLGFAYCAVLLAAAGIDGEGRDRTLFIAGALLLPLFCAAVQVFLVRPDLRWTDCRTGRDRQLLGRHRPSVCPGSLAAPDLRRRQHRRPMAAKRQVGRRDCGSAARSRLAHRRGRSAVLVRPLSLPVPVRSRAVQACLIAIGLFAASFLLFWIDPSDRHLNLFIRLFFEPPFSDSPAPFELGPALLLAALLLAAVAALGWLEHKLLQRGSAALQTIRTSALCVAVILTVVCYFDFSLNIDVFHYLANVGPAVHALHGGTPMVDTFSLYGPGPVVATLVGFKIGPVTFGTAQIVNQVFNFAFYAFGSFAFTA